MNYSDSTLSSPDLRELALRQNDGVCVTLWWNASTDEISLSVKSESEDFTVRDIPHNSALDAWNHPYAYADFMLKSGRAISRV